MSLSERLQEMATGATSSRSSYWKALSDPRVITLGGGDPDFDTPRHISQAAVDAIRQGKTHYSPSQGILPLREAVSERVQRKYGVEVSPEEVQITSGAANALFLAIHSLVRPGDRVVLLQPAMGFIISQIKLAGGQVMPLWLENDEPLLERREELADLLVGARMLVSTSPSNPTGRVMKAEEIGLLIELTKESGCYLLSDEVYDELIFDDTPFATALCDEHRDRVLLVNSLSKTYAMTGWRLGYLIAAQPVRELTTRLFTLSVSHINTPTQFAGIAALNSDQECVGRMVREYQMRRDALVAGLDEIPRVRPWKPNSGLFCFVDISPTGLSSSEVCQGLLEESHVFVIPGSGYGIEGDRFIRITYANASVDVLKEACSRMAGFFVSTGGATISR